MRAYVKRGWDLKRVVVTGAVNNIAMAVLAYNSPTSARIIAPFDGATPINATATATVTGANTYLSALKFTNDGIHDTQEANQLYQATFGVPT